MIDTTILGFAEEYMACRSFETEFDICCRIAGYAGIPKPINYDDCHRVLQWLDQHHSETYQEANRPNREFWQRVLPDYICFD